jgi:hypothetical protein
VTLRSRTLVLLTISGLALVGCKKEQPVALGDFHRYSIERAHVHYVYSGLGRGVEDLYFEHYGTHETKFANWQHIEDAALRPTVMLTIALGPEIYMCMLDRREGTHFKDPELDSLFHLSAANLPSPDVSTSESLSKKGKIVGQDTILGLIADVWKINDAPLQLSIWKSVLLKRVVMMKGDTVAMTAASVDTTSPIDPKVFVVPPSIKITERPAPPPPPGQ